MTIFSLTAFICTYFSKFYYLYIAAFLVAFSRVYLGVHYSSDVVAGGIIGSMIGYGFAIFAKRVYSTL
jgi:undecaprenyl-diphosphatase